MPHLNIRRPDLTPGKVGQVETFLGADGIPVVHVTTVDGSGPIRITLDDHIVWDDDPETGPIVDLGITPRRTLTDPFIVAAIVAYWREHESINGGDFVDFIGELLAHSQHDIS
jgi:hypothetical protein